MTSGKLVPAIIVALVAAAVVAGLVVSGSPQRQRELRFDQRRVADLRSLSSALERRYRETGELPAALELLVDGRIVSALPRDPVSEMQYGYETTTRSAYRLCAEFTLAAENVAPGEFWDHGPGRHCYAFDYSELRRN